MLWKQRFSVYAILSWLHSLCGSWVWMYSHHFSICTSRARAHTGDSRYSSAGISTKSELCDGNTYKWCGLSLFIVVHFYFMVVWYRRTQSNLLAQWQELTKLVNRCPHEVCILMCSHLVLVGVNFTYLPLLNLVGFSLNSSVNRQRLLICWQRCV